MPSVAEKRERGDDQRRRLDAHLGELLELSPAEREARLERVDEGLRSELRQLLRAAFDPESRLVPGGAASPSLLEAAVTDSRPRRVGPYRLTREIGRGGMGVVYLAERADGQFDRRVAVKVVRLDAANPDLDRFSREQQILAGLNHPGVARLYDGGVTEAGESYFVMEHVDGSAIDQYCRREHLDMAKRIRLVEDVCDAVSAAHRQLVVHRDLKPSNILVDRAGQVKLLDFGIASLETDDAVPTRTIGRGRLTLQYASPEQLAGEGVTTASDVYQLGLLLFELVTCTRPYELSGLELSEARSVVDGGRRKALREAARVERGERVEPKQRIPRIRDLQAIVDRALNNEPSLRYPSVERLKADLRCYRECRPVAAREPKPGLRARRFACRHPLALSATALAMVGVLALTTVFTVRLTRERDARLEQALRAERVGEQSERVAGFLTGLFRSADPLRTDRADLSARELLDRGVQELAVDLEGQPLLKARMLAVTGDIYLELGLLDQAGPLLEESLELRLRESGTAPEVARSRSLLGKRHRLLGDYEKAETQLEAARPVLESAGEAGSLAANLTELGNLYEALGRAKDALELRLRVLELQREENDLRGEANASINLSNSLRRVGRSEEARRHLQSAIDILERIYGKDHPALAMPLMNLGILESQRGADSEAVALNERALALARSAYGEEHERTIWVLNNLGINHARLGHFEEARSYYLQSLVKIQRRQADHPKTSGILNNLGSMEWKLGRPAEAEAYYRRALELNRAQLPPQHPNLGITLTNLGEALLEQGKSTQAEAALWESREILVSALGDDHVLVSYPNLLLARILEGRAEVRDAGRLLAEAVRLRRGAEGIDPEDVRSAETQLEEFRQRRESAGEAENQSTADL